MPLTVKAIDGAVFHGSANQIVRKMRSAAWMRHITKRTYKQDVLTRVMGLPTTPLSWMPPSDVTDSVVFLEALDSAGVIKVTLDA